MRWFERRGLRRRLRRLTVYTVVTAMFGLSSASSESLSQATEKNEAPVATENVAAYVLGPKDKVRVHAVEWRASQGETFEWKVLNLDYTIDVDGSISVPLVGDVRAMGLTKTALARAIIERLRANLGLAYSPDVTVEIVECRPFYVMGDVSKPGEYPYRPGMTVLQAVSIAGGYLTAQRDRSDAIKNDDELRGALASLQALSVRKERYVAELNGKELEFPAYLEQSSGSIARTSLSQEKRIFDVNREWERKELRALQELEQFYIKEIALLEERLRVNAKTVALIATEKVDLTSLRGQGLTTRQRQFDIELQSTQIETEKLRVHAELTKARQELSRTSIAISQLEGKRRANAATEVRNAQLAINATERKVELMARLLSGVGDSAAAHRTFRVVRSTSTGTRELIVSEIEPMQPGDVLKVDYEMRLAPNIYNAEPASDRLIKSAGRNVLGSSDEPPNE
ncbi:MAG: polysaccharide biosynthesis/export family protein [Hyphomicrobiaceae bacterium]